MYFQGFVSKKLDVLPAFREHFFVLQPHLLTLYASASEKEKRAEIPINGQCRVESIPDSKSKSPLKKVTGGKHHSRLSLFAVVFSQIKTSLTCDFDLGCRTISIQLCHFIVISAKF